MNNTIALYVNGHGCLVKVINGVEIPCSPEQSIQMARDIMVGYHNSYHNDDFVAHRLPNTILRGSCLEQKQGDANASITWADLLPAGYNGVRGTFYIMTEFVPHSSK